MDNLTTLKKIKIDEIPTEIELAEKAYTIAWNEVAKDPQNPHKLDALEKSEEKLKEIQGLYHEGFLILLKREIFYSPKD